MMLCAPRQFLDKDYLFMKLSVDFLKKKMEKMSEVPRKI